MVGYHRVFKISFTCLRKVAGKFDCLIEEVLFIRKSKTERNVQTDSLTMYLIGT